MLIANKFVEKHEEAEKEIIGEEVVYIGGSLLKCVLDIAEGRIPEDRVCTIMCDYHFKLQKEFKKIVNRTWVIYRRDAQPGEKINKNLAMLCREIAWRLYWRGVILSAPWDGEMARSCADWVAVPGVLVEKTKDLS